MYSFRLEALLKHRKHQEEILQRELALARRQMLAEQKILHAQKASLRQHQSELQLRQQQGRRVSEILLVVDYLGKLTRDLDKQQKRVAAAEQAFQKSRRDLIEAVKKRKILEKLKERQWERHEQGLRKKERDAMDEVATTRFQRNIQLG
jgi:flagellar FliJ protein